MAKSNNRAAMAQTGGKLPAEVEKHAIDNPPQSDYQTASDYSYNAFIQESTLDEIAFMGGADPLELRRKLMTPYPVAIRLIDAVERMSGWKTPLVGNRARGFAFTLSYGTWVAEVVQVAQEDAGIRVEKIFCVADPGIVHDERRVRQQMMSSIIRSLSSALGRDFAGSAAKGADVSVLPEIKLELLAYSRQTRGAPEPATPPVMPALANAVFALTGKRVRRMPLGDEVVFVSTGPQ